MINNSQTHSTPITHLHSQPIEDRDYLLDVLVEKFQKRPSQIEALNDTPLYPTEQVLFDENVVPDEYFSEGCLALPKLNLQFLVCFCRVFADVGVERGMQGIMLVGPVGEKARRVFQRRLPCHAQAHPAVLGMIVRFILLRWEERHDG